MIPEIHSGEAARRASGGAYDGGNGAMWVVTKSDWPVLINLARAAQIGYQQIVKYDARTRVVASMWEQEFVLAECADGDEARAMIDRLASALASGEDILDLRGIEPAGTDSNAASHRS